MHRRGITLHVLSIRPDINCNAFRQSVQCSEIRVRVEMRKVGRIQSQTRPKKGRRASGSLSLALWRCHLWHPSSPPGPWHRQPSSRLPAPPSGFLHPSTLFMLTERDPSAPGSSSAPVPAVFLTCSSIFPFLLGICRMLTVASNSGMADAPADATMTSVV